MPKLTSIQLAYAKKYRDNNREAVLGRTREWRNKNREYIKRYSQEYKEKNKIRDMERAKKYRQTERGKQVHRKEATKYYYKNREKILERITSPEGKTIKRKWAHKNRAKVLWYAQKRRILTQDLTPELIQRVYEDNIKKYGTLTCILCYKPIEFGQDSLEHKRPLIRGGTNEYENLAIAHLKCNLKKNRRTLSEWREIYG